MKQYENKSLSNQFPRVEVTEEFVERNKFRFADPEKIKAAMEASNGFLNFAPEVYINYLPFENAKSLLKEEYVTAVDTGTEKWTYITDIYEAVQDFLDYLVFAYGKALDERGISASRSVQKLGAWLLILGREDLKVIIEDGSLYNPYGAPALVKVSLELGLEVPQELLVFAKEPVDE